MTNPTWGKTEDWITFNSLSSDFFLPSLCVVSCYWRVWKTVLNLVKAESSKETRRSFTLHFDLMSCFYSAKFFSAFESCACCFVFEALLKNYFLLPVLQMSAFLQKSNWQLDLKNTFWFVAHSLFHRSSLFGGVLLPVNTFRYMKT